MDIKVLSWPNGCQTLGYIKPKQGDLTQRLEESPSSKGQGAG